MNGHFAAVGDGPTAGQYEHGIQVIDEDKQYKFVPSPATLSASTRRRPPGRLVAGVRGGDATANVTTHSQHEPQ
jgi:hypothetical protein